MRRAELTRSLESVEPFTVADAVREQVITPTEAAVELLEAALARDDLIGRTVVDLGAGTGRLSIGAALLGAASVTAVESDPQAIAVARRNVDRAGVDVELIQAEVEAFARPLDVVLMNPPFGAQRRHADRPFWEAAFRCARRRTYAFALAASRTFIARSCVERAVPIAETRPIRWTLPATFRHHRKPRVELAVDLWVLGSAPRS
jgi:putative methylase